MKKKAYNVLFLGKANDTFCEQALNYCQVHFENVTVNLCRGSDPDPIDIFDGWSGDIIVSYLYSKIIPKSLLERTKVAAINFHPGSPEYPGIGCHSFALYHNSEDYGVTCHHMAEKVDTGKIIAVKRFPIQQTDHVASLLLKSFAHQLSLFYSVIDTFLRQGKLTESSETWKRKPYTRKDLKNLLEIDGSIEQEELNKIIRATHYGTSGPKIKIQDKEFILKEKAPDIRPPFFT